MADVQVRKPVRRARRKAEPAPTTADAIEMAMEALSHDRSEESPAREVLRRHGQLLGWQIASERMSVVLKVLTGVAGVAAAVALGVMVWTAAHDHGLVVEAFQTPPEDAARGLNGVVLASKVLDRIAGMDARSNSVRASHTYQNNWGADLKVEIAGTGVTLPELQRFLRGWLGHQTRISGELLRDGERLSLTVRTGGREGFTVTGGAGELDRIVQIAAEKLYGATQPYQYSKYLEYQDRRDESLAVARDLAVSGPLGERVWAYAQLANLLMSKGDPAGSLAAATHAARLDPNNALAQINLSSSEFSLGHEEAALISTQRCIALIRRGRDLAANVRAAILPLNEASLAQLRNDLERAEAIQTQALDFADFQRSDRWSRLVLSQIAAQRHDMARARALRLAGSADGQELDLVGQLRYTSAPLIGAILETAEVGDWPGVAALVTRLKAAGEAQNADLRPIFDLQLDPYMAEALARQGDVRAAEALLARLPGDCDLCLRKTAVVAALAGQPARSDSLFARAAARTPSLAVAPLEWGQAKLARGDAAGALAQAQDAARRAPKWADPLKLKGDALARLGKDADALKAYARAGELAPRWGALQLAQGKALARLGRRDQARDLARTALTLALTPQDRAAAAALAGPRAA